MAANTRAEQSGALTGYRAIRAAAHAQAEKARAKRDAERDAMHLPRLRNGLSSHSFAPMGQSRAATSLGPRAQMRAEGILEQFVPADATSGTHASMLPTGDGQMAPGASGTPQPRLRPQPGGNTGTAYATTNQTSTAFSGTSLDDAFEDYFFRQSRLPPSAGTAFNPSLSPIWAGLKLPG